MNGWLSHLKRCIRGLVANNARLSLADMRFAGMQGPVSLLGKVGLVCSAHGRQTLNIPMGRFRARGCGGNAVADALRHMRCARCGFV